MQTTHAILLLLIGIALCGDMVLASNVIAQYRAFFDHTNIDLPFTTRAVFAVARCWYLVGPLVLGLAFGLARWARSPHLRTIALAIILLLACAFPVITTMITFLPIWDLPPLTP